MSATSLWARWKVFARRVGNFQARVILTLFYFTIALPFGVIYRLVADPLAMKRVVPRWHPRPQPGTDLDALRRQD